LRIDFVIDAWCAYSPGWQHHPAATLLEQELATDVKFLPPLKRRRLSALTRLSLRLAHTIAPEFQGKCVFGSQHGELLTTQGLLQSIVEHQIVSPMGFSASVHNTAVGVYSINSQNRSACTSIAAGLDSLVMCFVEAYAILQSELDKQVLIVFADDVLPDGLAEIANSNPLHGFAALLSLNGQNKDNKNNKIELLRVQLEPVTENSARVDDDSIGAIIDCLVEGHLKCYTIGENNDWHWQFNNE